MHRPRKRQQFIITFPYPVKVNDRSPMYVDFVQISNCQNDFATTLRMQKALREPFPREFDHPKWPENCLKPWDERDDLNSIETHVDNQFVSILHDPLLHKSPLNRIRGLIRCMFLNALTLSSEIFVIKWHDLAKDMSKILYPAWYIRVHQPILTFSTGVPILVLSAMDFYRGYNLVTERKLHRDKFLGHMGRLYCPEGVDTDHTDIGTTYTREEMELFRYVLRLNSTKIEPNTWQINNLPFEEGYNVWLPTFISPLYLDSKIDMDFINTLKDVSESKVNDGEAAGQMKENSFCDLCKKVPQNLKRCSRCRAVFYCSPECQRADWAKHKASCIKN